MERGHWEIYILQSLENECYFDALILLYTSAEVHCMNLYNYLGDPQSSYLYWVNLVVSSTGAEHPNQRTVIKLRLDKIVE